jgi:hypothetical protein
MATDNIRVRIKQHISRFPYWYKDRINDEFDVKDYTPEYYIVEDAKFCILKSDCEVIESLSTTVNSETKETAEQKANSIDMNTYVNHLSEIVGIDKQPETQETMKCQHEFIDLFHREFCSKCKKFKTASDLQPEAQPQQEGEEVEDWF